MIASLYNWELAWLNLAVEGPAFDGHNLLLMIGS